LIRAQEALSSPEPADTGAAQPTPSAPIKPHAVAPGAHGELSRSMKFPSAGAQSRGSAEKFPAVSSSPCRHPTQSPAAFPQTSQQLTEIVAPPAQATGSAPGFSAIRHRSSVTAPMLTCTADPEPFTPARLPLNVQPSSVAVPYCTENPPPEPASPEDPDDDDDDEQ